MSSKCKRENLRFLLYKVSYPKLSKLKPNEVSDILHYLLHFYFFTADIYIFPISFLLPKRDVVVIQNNATFR